MPHSDVPFLPTHFHMSTRPPTSAPARFELIAPLEVPRRQSLRTGVGESALAILALAMVVAAGALIHWGRGQVMTGDDLFYAQRLSENTLGHVILHSNVYLIAVPMVVYKAMFELFGIGSYVPYRLAAIVLALLCAALFYSIARRRIGSLLALAPTILLLFLGSGWEELITGMRLPSLFAIASGLARNPPPRARGRSAATPGLAVPALRLGHLTSHRAGVPCRRRNPGRLPAPAATVEVLVGGPDPGRAVRRVPDPLSTNRRQRPGRPGRAGLRPRLLDHAHRGGLGPFRRAGGSGLRPAGGGNRVHGPPGRDRGGRRTAMEAPSTDVLGRGRRAGHSAGGDPNVPGRIHPGCRMRPATCTPRPSSSFGS